MKFFLLFIFLTSVAYAIRQKEELEIPNASQTIYVDQQIRLAQSSFSPLYLHVFEIVADGPAKHLNLTDKLKDEVMRVKSFKLLKDNRTEIWLVYLKRKGDDKIYVCEIEDALLSEEIILLN